MSEETDMTVIEALGELALRSHDATWTYARWELLPDDGNRYEIIDGVLFMTTAPSNFHQWIIRRLDRFIGMPLEDRGEAYVFTAPIGLLMPFCDPVQPDFLLIRQANATIIRERRIFGVPDLIAEVVSPSNAEQDTKIKRSAYARAGVPEYWIIRPDVRNVLVCLRPDPDLADYTQTLLLAGNDQLKPSLFTAQIEIEQLFAGAPDTTL
jgi:Uma2 family endonuclease